MTEVDKQSALAAGYASRVEMLRKLGPRGWLKPRMPGGVIRRTRIPAMLEWTVDEMAKSDPEILIAMFELVSNADAAPYLPRIAAPVLALYPGRRGDHQRRASRSCCEAS